MDLFKCIDCALGTISRPYVLIEGSLLGAIRDKAFIPWDRDGDLEIYSKNPDDVFSPNEIY